MVITYCSLLLIALAFIIGKKRKDLGFLVSFLFLPLFVNFFLTGGWSWFHHSVFLSLSSLALAVSIVNITDVISKTSLRSLLASSFMAVFVILGVVDITYNNRLMSKYDYNSFMTRVTTVVPEDSTVMGASLYYPVFINRNNRFVGYLFLEERCPDFADEIHKLDVDYILLDNNLRVSSLVWCSEDYYRNQILGFLKSKRNIEITAHYPSRNIVMKSVYLYTVND